MATDIEKLVAVMALETNGSYSYSEAFTLTDDKGNTLQIERRELPNGDYIIFDKTNNEDMLQVSQDDGTYSLKVFIVKSKEPYKIGFNFDVVDEDDGMGPELGGISGGIIKSPPYYNQNIQARDGKASIDSMWIQCTPNPTPEEEEERKSRLTRFAFASNSVEDLETAD